MNNCFSIRLLRERLSEKVHATFPKGILCGFELTVRSHERPWTYVCECQRKAPEVGSTATECQEQCIDHIPYHLSGLSRAHFFLPPFSKELYTHKVISTESERKPLENRLVWLTDEFVRWWENKFVENSKSLYIFEWFAGCFA